MVFSFNSSCFVKEEVLLPDFHNSVCIVFGNILYLQSLGEENVLFSIFQCVGFETLETGQIFDDILKSARLKVKHCLITKKKKFMASIALQMHETPGLWSLAPACRLYTFCSRFSTTEKLPSSDFMINKHFMKQKTLFQEKVGEKSPILSLATLLFLFSTLLSLPFAAGYNGLSAILFPPKLYRLILFLFYSRIFSWFLMSAYPLFNFHLVSFSFHFSTY